MSDKNRWNALEPRMAAITAVVESGTVAHTGDNECPVCHVQVGGLALLVAFQTGDYDAATGIVEELETRLGITPPQTDPETATASTAGNAVLV